MSSTHYARPRLSPPSTRKTAVKAARPSLSRAPVKGSLKGNGKVKQTTDKAEEEDPEIPLDEDEDDMATSFLQFCMTCERQILVPKNSLLYCSERCKRMDAGHVSSYTSYASVNSPSSSDDTDTDAFGSTKRSPVERARPTPRPMLSARIPPDAHEGKSDLDPTEWKPKLPHRPNSDASKFLGQFHRTPPGSFSPRRPAAIHAQTAGSVPITAPSLSATPSASSTSSSGDSEAGTPYDFVNRPLLMRRCHPMRPHSAAVKSPDLVTPQIPAAYGGGPHKPKADGKPTIKVAVPPTAAAAVAENMAFANDLTYAKKWDLAHSHGSGSLTALLGPASLEHKAPM